MKIKVCGLKYSQNILDIAELRPDMMGFIFYDKSPRNVDINVIEHTLATLKPAVSLVGVFVNETVEKVTNICQSLGLDYAQLHGNESPSYCAQIKSAGISVIKAFHVDGNFDMALTGSYAEYSALFLFDTKTEEYGGSGKHFDWSLLSNYNSNTPFLLSGGISHEDIEEIKSLSIPKLLGIDVNSGVEISPGTKDLKKTREMILKTRQL